MDAPPLRSAEVLRFHDATIAAFKRGEPADRAPPADPLWAAIETNHRNNCRLWAEEDLARRRDVPASAIAANKRAIDGFNQARNDAVESIDETLLGLLGLFTPASDAARLNSETAGSMVDRLSIIALKIHHMREQTERDDASSEHRARCRDKLALLLEQRADLAGCLDRLLAECQAGTAYFKVYRQFKMYNDPTLNPALYQRVAAPSPEGSC